MPQRGHELVHPAGGDPEQVAGRHHAGQRPLGALPALEEPVGEVGAGAQLRDRDVQGAGAGVEVAVPVAVTTVDPVRGARAVLGTAHRVGLSRQQRVDERGRGAHATDRGSPGRAVPRAGGQGRYWVDGHRRVLLRVGCRRSLEGSRGGRHCFYSDTLTGLPVIHHSAENADGNTPRTLDTLRVGCVFIGEVGAPCAANPMPRLRLTPVTTAVRPTRGNDGMNESVTTQ
jgi:hypothetical protein